MLPPATRRCVARPIRVQFSGAVCHCCARGDERQPIFRDDDDRGYWLATVDQMRDQFGGLVHACLCVAGRQVLTTMPDHYVDLETVPW